MSLSQRPVPFWAVVFWGERSWFGNALGRMELGWVLGTPRTLPGAACPMERRGFGDKAAQRWATHLVLVCQWSPRPPACPQGTGKVARGMLARKPHGHRFLSPQMVSKLPLMKTICNLHLDKLEFFRLLHPETAVNFPPLYKEVFNSELQYSDPRES